MRGLDNFTLNRPPLITLLQIPPLTPLRRPLDVDPMIQIRSLHSCMKKLVCAWYVAKHICFSPGKSVYKMVGLTDVPSLVRWEARNIYSSPRRNARKASLSLVYFRWPTCLWQQLLLIQRWNNSFFLAKSHRKEGYSSSLWRARSLVLACELAFLDDVVLHGEVLTLEVPVQHVPHTLGIPQLHGLFVSRRTSQIWSKVKTE